ncbi:MAG TPA: YihY/virulence factor BrkB family protein [Bryobacteraceae bacterium]|nr:YihY/virulence factor BrkB family protein [Bryobacteraceae bacterium]
MHWIWNLGGLTWRELARRVYGQILKDDVLGRAAQLSYYFLLALFPLMVFLMVVLGYLADTGTWMRERMLEYLAHVVPPSAFTLILDTLDAISNGGGSGKLSLGLLGAIWAASAGMNAVIRGLNIAYGVKEARVWWRARLVAITLTLALSISSLFTLTLFLWGDRIGSFVAEWLGHTALFQTIWSWAQPVLVVAFLMATFSAIYRFAPNLEEQKWVATLPGAVLGVTIWLLASYGLRLYLVYFTNYNKTYGSVGAVIILMLWFYVTSLALLIGGEINSEIENAAAERREPGAKFFGERMPHEHAWRG